METQYNPESVRRNARQVIAKVAERPGANQTPQGTLAQVCRVVTAATELGDSYMNELKDAAQQYADTVKENAKVARDLAKSSNRQMWIIALIMLAQLAVLALSR